MKLSPYLVDGNRYCFLALSLLLFCAQASAQKIISGIVSDESGPLPGVSIIEKGTSNGTVTDFDGAYTINVTNEDAIIVFSYLGFLSQEQSSSQNDTLNIQMQEDVQGLEEIVVTGYGTQKKATLTGSIATIGGEALEKSASPNLGTALAGKVAGLYIDTGNGAPGADDPGIRVRGSNTFNNSSALIVIDGIPNRAGGLSRINPDHASDPYGKREARFYSTLLFDGASWKVRTSDVTKHDNFNEIQTGYYTFSEGNYKPEDGNLKNGVDTRQGPIEDWNGSRTGYYFKKFADPYSPASWPNNLQKLDAPYIRYTEILLNYVEATINLGEDSDAKSWLNKLRFRNGLPEVTASGSDLLEIYKRERDKELVNEDARLFDMKRWLEGSYSLDKQVQQILIQATQKAGSSMTPDNYRKSFADFDYLYRPTDIVFENIVWKDHVYFTPIPQEEIDRDPSIQQNPGY